MTDIELSVGYLDTKIDSGLKIGSELRLRWELSNDEMTLVTNTVNLDSTGL